MGRVVDTTKLDFSSVRLLTKVTIKNISNNSEMVYSIVPEAEADLKSKKISVSSPIGKGLLGKSVGEIAEIQVPNGIIKFEVLKIEGYNATSIFTKIINNEIPSYKIIENDHFLAFLDAFPLKFTDMFLLCQKKKLITFLTYHPRNILDFGNLQKKSLSYGQGIVL